MIRGCVEAANGEPPIIYVENNCVRESPSLIMLLSELGYTLYWDVQPYYNVNNYKDRGMESPFGDTSAVNMIGIMEGVHRVTLTNFAKGKFFGYSHISVYTSVYITVYITVYISVYIQSMFSQCSVYARSVIFIRYTLEP